MQKNYFLALTIVLSICFSSCKKENSTQKLKLPAITNPLVVTPTYYYTDLILDPRPPGQTYDTYHVLYNNVLLTITNLTWDSATYPTLVNGTPAYGIVTINPSTQTGGQLYPATGDGTLGTQYTLVRYSLCGLPGPNLHADIQKFEAAMSAISSTHVVPFLNDYVNKDYGTAGCPQTPFNFRLIRCTTGTHFGIATGDYPYAVKPNNSLGNPTALVLVNDPSNSSIQYELYGTNGVVTGYTNKHTGLSDLDVSVVGTYTAIPNNSTNYHCIGKIFRHDNSSFDYDVTQDIY